MVCGVSIAGVPLCRGHIENRRPPIYARLSASPAPPGDRPHPNPPLPDGGTVPTGLTSARWTHVALPTGDLDKAIDFYTSVTPLVVVERFKDADGESVWLSNADQVETPMVLVLVSFNKDKGGQLGLLTPFAHIGI
jgi:hypothetical protein